MQHKRNLGFSLIEVLVTLVIVAIALLGLLAVQSRAFSMQADTFNQRAATELLSQMRERVSGNFAGYATAVKTGNNVYNRSFTPGAMPAITACANVNACVDTTEVPAQLFTQWAQLAVARLPGAVGDMTLVSTGAGTFGLNLTIGWTEPTASSNDSRCDGIGYITAAANRAKYRCTSILVFPG
jgi:type IV pilus assembly protein PilV